MNPCREKSYKFRDANVAPSVIGLDEFIVKDFSLKTKWGRGTFYSMLVFCKGQIYRVDIPMTTWEAFVRPYDWFIESGYFTVSIAGLEAAYCNEPRLAQVISDRREPFYISVENDNMDGFVRFMVNPGMLRSEPNFKIPSGLFNVIFKKYNKTYEGALHRDSGHYRFGPKPKLEFMELKPTGITPAEMKKILNLDKPKASVSFDFKNDQDRLNAIEFLKNMKVHND